MSRQSIESILPEHLMVDGQDDTLPRQEAMRRLEGQRFLLAVREWFDKQPGWNGGFRLESRREAKEARYYLGDEVFDGEIRALIPHVLSHEQAVSVSALIQEFERAARNGHAELAAVVAEALNESQGRPAAIEVLLMEACTKNGNPGFDPRHLFDAARAAWLDETIPRSVEHSQGRPRM